MTDVMVLVLAAAGAAFMLKTATGGPPLAARRAARWAAGLLLQARSADTLVGCWMCLSVYAAAVLAPLAWLHPLLVAPFIAPLAPMLIETLGLAVSGVRRSHVTYVQQQPEAKAETTVAPGCGKPGCGQTAKEVTA